MLPCPSATLRSLAAVASGTSSLLTDTLLPDTLRESTFTECSSATCSGLFQNKSRRYRPNPAHPPGDPTAAPDYVQRKMFGSALDTAGLFAMHVSPLWVLALAGDAAAGSNTFLVRLVDQLKKKPRHSRRDAGDGADRSSRRGSGGLSSQYEGGGDASPVT